MTMELNISLHPTITTERSVGMVDELDNNCLSLSKHFCCLAGGCGSFQ